VPISIEFYSKFQNKIEFHLILETRCIVVVSAQSHQKMWSPDFCPLVQNVVFSLYMVVNCETETYPLTVVFSRAVFKWNQDIWISKRKSCNHLDFFNMFAFQILKNSRRTWTPWGHLSNISSTQVVKHSTFHRKLKIITFCYLWRFTLCAKFCM